MHAGLEGLMSAMYLRQLAVHVRRGQAGRVREGLSGGGLTYGYAPVPGKRGERAVVEAEAEIVRRVFAEYVAGRTPRDARAVAPRAPKPEFKAKAIIHRGGRIFRCDRAAIREIETPPDSAVCRKYCRTSQSRGWALFIARQKQFRVTIESPELMGPCAFSGVLMGRLTSPSPLLIYQPVGPNSSI